MLALADKGYAKALADNVHLARGLNIHKGDLTYKAVAESLNLPFTAWAA